MIQLAPLRSGCDAQAVHRKGGGLHKLNPVDPQLETTPGSKRATIKGENWFQRLLSPADPYLERRLPGFNPLKLVMK
jgi:hypothetical protein